MSDPARAKIATARRTFGFQSWKENILQCESESDGERQKESESPSESESESESECKSESETESEGESASQSESERGAQRRENFAFAKLARAARRKILQR